MATLRYLRTSTGRKVLMGISGAALFGFIVMHLLGNLQIFLGPEKINAYAEFLESIEELLWFARIALLSMIGIHIACAVSLTLENRAARPVEYQNKKYIKASYASRTMAMSGLIVFSFIIYHLLHFTVGAVHSQYSHFVDPKGRHDVYSMVVMSFQNPWISLSYMVSIFLLCLHLSHGLSSMFQSIGLNNEEFRPTLVKVGSVVAWLIFLGYVSIPASVLLGIVKLPAGVILP